MEEVVVVSVVEKRGKGREEGGGRGRLLYPSPGQPP
jgi:hypothetical protein